MRSILLPLLCLFSLPTIANNNSDITEGLSHFILGQYQLIGKKIDSQDTYVGQLIISAKDTNSENVELIITRIIDGKTTHGSAAIETTMHSESTVLRMRFTNDDINYENTCLIRGDLDNYARISCYLYQPNVRTDDPGLEALFIDHRQKR